MRRLLTATLVAFMVVGLFPLTVLAAPPVANAATPSTNEDTPYPALLLASDDDGDPVTAFSIATTPGHGTLGSVGSIDCDGLTPSVCTATVTYTPDADWNGEDGFTYAATAGGEESAPATVTITVNPVNDPPSFTVGGDQSIAEDAGPQTVNEFIVGTAPGPGTAADEAGQALAYTVVADQPTLFSAQPQISAGGTLTYTTAADASGSATVSVDATDDGTPAAQSATQTFDITVTSENDPPTFSIAGDKGVDEDGGEQQFAGFITASSPGPADEAAQIIAYSLAVTNTGLFAVQPAVAADGQLSFTPEANAFGSTAVDVFATDSGGAVSGTQTFTITINNVNDGPSFTTGPDVQVAKGEGAYDQPWATAISPGAGESDAVTFSVTPLDGSLFTVAPAIGSDGRLTFTPGSMAGSTSVTVSATDDGSPAASTPDETFTITITDGPAAIAQAPHVDEDSADNPITLTGFDPESDALDFAVVGTPTHGTLSGTAPDLTYTPNGNFFGTDAFTFTVTDTITVSPTATVTITVDNVNDPVDARSDSVTIKPATTTTLDLFKANGGSADTAGTGEPTSELTIIAVSKPLKGTATISNGGKTVTFDPTRCTYGSDQFTYTISDGQFTDTATVAVRILRPGEAGLSKNPVTDEPAVGFVSGTTEGTTIPVKVSWCGATASGSNVRSYRVQQSTNGGTSYGSTLYSATTGTSTTRSLSVGTRYRWLVRTLDTAGRTGYRSSPVSRLGRIQTASAAITYTGSWSTSTTTRASGGSSRLTSAAGATAEISLTDIRSFAIVGTKAANRGSFRVYVDSVLVATVSAKSSTTAYRRLLFVRGVTSGLSVTHVVKIEAVGNGYVDLDAILTLGTP